jgi:hypothetical protein
LQRKKWFKIAGKNLLGVECENELYLICWCSEWFEYSVHEVDEANKQQIIKLNVKIISLVNQKCLNCWTFSKTIDAFWSNSQSFPDLIETEKLLWKNSDFQINAKCISLDLEMVHSETQIPDNQQECYSITSCLIFNYLMNKMLHGTS